MILGSRRTRGVRRTAPGKTAERLLHGAPGPVGLVPWDYEAASIGPIKRWPSPTSTPRTVVQPSLLRSRYAPNCTPNRQLVTVIGRTPESRRRWVSQAFIGTRNEHSFAAALEEASRILPEGLTSTTRLLGGPVVDALGDLRPEDADVLVPAARGLRPGPRVGYSSAASRHASSGTRDYRSLIVPRNPKRRQVSGLDYDRTFGMRACPSNGWAREESTR